MGFFDTLGKVAVGLGNGIVAIAEVAYANSHTGRLESVLKQVRACDLSVEDAMQEIESLFERKNRVENEVVKQTSSYSGMGSSYTTSSSIRDSILKEWEMAKKPLEAKYLNKLNAGLTISAGHILEEIQELNKKYETRLRAL